MPLGGCIKTRPAADAVRRPAFGTVPLLGYRSLGLRNNRARHRGPHKWSLLKRNPSGKPGALPNVPKPDAPMANAPSSENPR